MKTDTSLVSIIMPVYGVERYIAKAIHSVLNQTYPHWELLVINDGSRDGSRDIAAEFEKQDIRIRIFDKPNGGLSDARNFGLQYIRGEYVHFFDSDDWIAPDFYEKLIQNMKPAYDFIICGYNTNRYDRSGILLETTSKRPKTLVYKKTINNIGFIHRYLPFMDFAWNKFYRSSFILQNRLQFDKKLHLIEDAEFMNRVLHCSLNFAFVDYAGYHYCQYPRKTLSSTFDKYSIGFCTRRLLILTDMLQQMGMDSETIKVAEANCAFAQYKFIFHTLYQSTIPNKRFYVRQVVNTPQLIEPLKSYKAIGMYDWLLLNLIRAGRIYSICGIYGIKRFAHILRA